MDGRKWNEAVDSKGMGVSFSRTSQKEACLIYDSFKTHLMESIKKRLKDVNTDVAIIPGGLTGQLQPLDVSINKPFKEKVRVLWSNWMASESDCELTR